MPERVESGAYSPELAKLMREALDGAWAKVQAGPEDIELTRRLLASAVIDLVNTGVRDRNELIDKAVGTLAAAKNASGERSSLTPRPKRP